MRHITTAGWDSEVTPDIYFKPIVVISASCIKHPTEEDLHLTSISGTNRNNISKYSPIRLFLNALLLRVDRTTLMCDKRLLPSC